MRDYNELIHALEVTISVEKLLPLKIQDVGIKVTSKYKQIAASIREFGMIEPLIVRSHEDQDDTYVVLDGHRRLSVAKEMDEEAVDCFVVVPNNEALTYNQEVNTATKSKGEQNEKPC